jgi:hypothetical protein
MSWTCTTLHERGDMEKHKLPKRDFPFEFILYQCLHANSEIGLFCCIGLRVKRNEEMSPKCEKACYFKRTLESPSRSMLKRLGLEPNKYKIFTNY